MLRRFWLLFVCLTASSLLPMATAHACAATVELGVVCLTDCDRTDEGRGSDDPGQPPSHHHGCHGQSAFVSDPVPVRDAVVAAVDPAVQASPRLLPREIKPAMRPPAA